MHRNKTVYLVKSLPNMLCVHHRTFDEISVKNTVYLYTVYIWYGPGQPLSFVVKAALHTGSNCMHLPPPLCTICDMYRVGQNHIYTVYIRYFWQGNFQIYGYIRCIYTVLANPKYVQQPSTEKCIFIAHSHSPVESTPIAARNHPHRKEKHYLGVHQQPHPLKPSS
jgi:hydrogenase maturation factor